MSSSSCCRFGLRLWAYSLGASYLARGPIVPVVESVARNGLLSSRPSWPGIPRTPIEAVGGKGEGGIPLTPCPSERGYGGERRKANVAL